MFIDDFIYVCKGKYVLKTSAMECKNFITSHVNNLPLTTTIHSNELTYSVINILLLVSQVLFTKILLIREVANKGTELKYKIYTCDLKLVANRLTPPRNNQIEREYSGVKVYSDQEA